VYTFPHLGKLSLGREDKLFHLCIEWVLMEAVVWLPFVGNCVEVWGSHRVADHELLRGSCMVREGFLLLPILKR